MNFPYSLIRVFKLLAACIIVVLFINVYILFKITTESLTASRYEVKTSNAKSNVRSKKIELVNTTSLAIHKIEERLSTVNSFFDTFSIPVVSADHFHPLLVKKATPADVNLWKIAGKWVTKDQITPSYAPLLGGVLDLLTSAKIENAGIVNKGTQLKVYLKLKGGQYALFKPKWYERNETILGSVYSGKDRHNGEIAAFHLSRLLGLHRAPIISGRIINLITEIKPVASTELLKTFYQDGNNTCFYGVCLYCKRTDGVCAKGHLLEGSIALWLPEEWSIKKARHPWQRSYNENPAKWEVYQDYCDYVRHSKRYEHNEDQLLDLVETSVFDFLIDNGDRHHYEFFSPPKSKVLLIDNGKSFGNSEVDHIDILAPLYQCCQIRKKFLSVLVSLQGGILSTWMKKILSPLPLSPLLSERHFSALDRRLNKVLSAVMVCFEEKGSINVIVTKGNV